MIPLEEYLNNPCGTSSLPYWKGKCIEVPPHMKIVHHRDFHVETFPGYTDTPYFRLSHPLSAPKPSIPRGLVLHTALPDDMEQIVSIINRSYDDLSVTLEQMNHYTQLEVYEKSLWILVSEEGGEAIGCGIADLDREAGEGILEWIQVLPAYRKRKIGQFLVQELLYRMTSLASYATVSGKVCSPSSPEILYRKCGFTGTDIWHILQR